MGLGWNEECMFRRIRLKTEKERPKLFPLHNPTRASHYGSEVLENNIHL